MANKRSISDEWKSWVARGGSAQNVPLNLTPGGGSSGGSGGSGSNKGSTGQSPLAWVLDIISRPKYAITGAISRGLSASQRSHSNAADAIGDVIGSSLTGMRDGFFSTNPKDHVEGIELYDQIGKAIDKDYVAPTLDNKPKKKVHETIFGDSEELKHTGLAVLRGGAGFGLDVALDPITYGTFGLGGLAKGVVTSTAKQIGKSTAKKVAEEAVEGASQAAVRDIAEAAAQGARRADQAIPDEAIVTPPVVAPRPTGAVNVAGPSRALERGAAVDRASAGFKLGPTLAGGAARSLPKVSETISTHNGSAVEALLNAQKRMSQVEKSAAEVAQEAAPAVAATARAAESAADSSQATLREFAESFFQGADADDVAALGRMRDAGGAGHSPIFPRTVINQLGKGTEQAQLGYLNKLVQVAKNPATSTPELRRFLIEAQQFLKNRRAAGAPKAAPKTAPAAQASEAATAATPRVAELLDATLKKGGRLTPEGAALKDAIGPELFSRISSKRVKPENREKAFEDVSRILTGADDVTPADLSGMDEAVQAFVRDKLQLRPEDFDMAARQKFLDYEVIRNTPRLSNPKSAAGAPVTEEIKEASEAIGMSVKQVRREVYAVASQIAKRTITGRDGKWVNGRFVFQTDEGLQYALKHARIDQYAFVAWANKAREAIDASVPLISSGKRAGKVSFPAITKARREQMPARVRAIEDELEASGIPIGVYADDTFVSLRQSDIYDAARWLEDNPPLGTSRSAISRQSDLFLFNPSTAVPESIMAEAYGAAIRGADDKLLDAILGQTKSKWNGVTIKRQPLGKGRNETLWSGTRKIEPKGKLTTSEQLRAEAIQYIRATLPYVEERAAATAGRYISKSVTDASAMTTRVMTEVNEALARSEGAGFAYMADLEKRVAELTQEFGASGHATGLVSEALAKQLPPFAVQRAKAVRSTGRAYTQAAKEGRTAAQIRQIGDASEFKHTPVDDAAAVDLDEISGLAQSLDETSEIYDLGTGAKSVRDAEAAARLWYQRSVHPLQKGFNQNYGTIVDGVNLKNVPIHALGSAAKDIYHMDRYIGEWGRKYTMKLGETDEMVSAAAFKLLQQGVDDVPPEILQLPGGSVVAEALQELKPIASRFFDIDNVGFAGDLYWRTGAKSVGYLERGLKTSGFTDKYGNVLTERLMQGEEGLSSWWRAVDVENPVEFLKQYNMAVHSALGDRVAMHTLEKQLRSAGLVSDTFKQGFARPVKNGKSFFFAGLEDSGLYIDKRVLDAMSEVDRMIHATRGFGPNSLITTALDPVMGAWRQGMTIFRLGHHVRNTMSNAGLSYIDQGMRNLTKSGAVATRILARREGGRSLEGMGELERLLLGETSGLSKGGADIAYTAKLRGGKKVELTYDDLHDAYSARGGFRTYRQSEDIIEGQGLIQKGADYATGQRGILRPVARVARAVSEGTDHFGLLQHFTQIVMNNARHVGGKFKSLDDLYDYAMKRAYRFHPDSQVLTPFEAKYMRRLISFYTWFKGTLPAVLESSLMHPGRVLVAPKASFNIAQTFGIDGESIANPWPEDAEVPDYMREMAFGANAIFGDQMYVMNPGLAHQDLASDFLGRGPSEGQGVVGNLASNATSALWDMATPFLKAPIELMAGFKLGSAPNEKGDRTKIRQAGDYIDDQIPFLNYLSKNTGISFGSTLAHLPEAIQQGRPIERSDVQMGYTPSIFDEGVSDKQKLSLINLLFGQGAQKVETKEQNDAKQDEAKQRRTEREDMGLYVAPRAKLSTNNSSSSGRSGGGGSSSDPMPEFTIPSGKASTPAPQQLSYSDAAAMVRSVLGDNVSPSALSSAIKAEQAAFNRQQSSLYRTDYYLQSLKQLQAANPELSISELMRILDKAYTDYE